MRTSGEIKEIWDDTRKKWLILTPEEWVRQHLVEYLIDEKRYPRGLLSLERGLKVNGLFRRTDLVVFGQDLQPVLIAECKAPGIKVSQAAFDQAARYNMTLRVPYLLITNGLKNYCCHIDFAHSSYSFLENIPSYSEFRDVGQAGKTPLL